MNGDTIASLKNEFGDTYIFDGFTWWHKSFSHQFGDTFSLKDLLGGINLLRINLVTLISFQD